MDAKFTKGNWGVKLYPDGANVTANGFSFIDVCNIGIDLDYEEKGFGHWADSESLTVDISLDEQFANAHLIAAAPEMYKMLNELICHFEYGNSDHFELNDEKIEPIKLLIAKARGDKEKPCAKN